MAPVRFCRTKGGCAMDKRIMKTRKGLKDALLCLLEEHPFEEITVTEICEQARTGRLTFYKYYSDKNELMRDCFQDLQEEIMDRMRKEGENIRGRLPQIFDDSGTGLTPRLNCLLCWMETFTDVVIDVLGDHSFQAGRFCTRYPVQQVNSFLAMGMWGYVFSYREGTDMTRTRQDAKALLRDLLGSAIFMQTTSQKS